ncbi:iron uptake system component EfeO [Roseiarcus fermentans]|uniref:Iron uptake system component EfeO n=1 Tax=Roseiarcus fermentans TaxID=1473586 RepID=A0A366FET4_9HYPH|nr:iron uptake system protein EfeO [Roseiarcus fermentans]RBP13183.1 iron uptake system component EfeO [Roseiarcus fermentans]
MTLANRLKMGALAAALCAPGLAWATQEAPLDLVQPIADYKLYVAVHTEKLIADATKFVAAIKAGDTKTAKALYAPTRMNYEAVEPVAELFSDLDSALDSRADDHEKKEEDPGFTGFHRLEYGLWEKNSTQGLSETADKLLADAKELHARIVKLTFPPEKVVGGAAALMEEVAKTKISGEEDRYSHTDLWDFKANFDGSQKIFVLLEPVLAKKDPDFVKKVAENFTVVDATLAKYRTAEGYEPYDKLSEPDRTVLSAKVNALAEDLSTLRGKLGLN